MIEFSGLSKLLILVGLFIAAIGVVLGFGVHIKWLGHFPGDIYIKKEHYTFYFPITTGVIICIILNTIFYLLRR